MTPATAAWTRWPHGGTPEMLLVLPDCPATDPDANGCSEYEGHPGGHTWQVDDPWNPVPHPGGEQPEQEAAPSTEGPQSVSTAPE
jgi:hypothetical protein